MSAPAQPLINSMAKAMRESPAWPVVFKADAAATLATAAWDAIDEGALFAIATPEELVIAVNEGLKTGDIDPDTLTLPAKEDDGDAEEFIEPSRNYVDHDALNEARVRFARGDYADTLYYLEKALGRGFLGLGDMRLEKA